MARRTLARFASRKKKRRADEGAKHNPPILTDMVEFVLPGFGGFAATRMVSRITHTQVRKRWPKLGKHAGAIAGVASFAAAWLLAHRWKPLARYHTPIVVGSAIAAIQTIAQTYLPKQLSWVVSDVPPAERSLPPAAAAAPVVDELEAQGDDEEWYTYNDAYDKGRYAKDEGPSATGASTAPVDDDLDDLQPIPGMVDDEDDLQGIFSGN